MDLELNEAKMECSGCTRREFVKDAAFTVVGILAALGAGDVAAAALPVHATIGRVSAGGVSYALPSADGAQIDEEHNVILVRWQKAVYAFSLSCPHQRTALRWDARNAQFRCPKHKSAFQPTGGLIDGKAKRAMDRYALARAGEQVEVDTSKVLREPDDPAAYAAAVLTL